MIVKLLTEHHLEFLSLKGGCRGSSESTLVKMSNCRKSHAVAHMTFRSSSLPDAIAGAIHNVPTMDTQWMETTAKKAALKLEKLDTDLKNYKSNSIKESIR